MRNPFKKQTEEEKTKGDEFDAIGEENVYSRSWLLKIYSMVGVLILTLVLIGLVEVADRTLPTADSLNFSHNSGTVTKHATSFETLRGTPTNGITARQAVPVVSGTPSPAAMVQGKVRKSLVPRDGDGLVATTITSTSLDVLVQTVAASPVLFTRTTTIVNSLVQTISSKPVIVSFTSSTLIVTVKTVSASAVASKITSTPRSSTTSIVAQGFKRHMKRSVTSQVDQALAAATTTTSSTAAANSLAAAPVLTTVTSTSTFVILTTSTPAPSIFTFFSTVILRVVSTSTPSIVSTVTSTSIFEVVSTFTTSADSSSIGSSSTTSAVTSALGVFPVLSSFAASPLFRNSSSSTTILSSADPSSAAASISSAAAISSSSSKLSSAAASSSAQEDAFLLASSSTPTAIVSTSASPSGSDSASSAAAASSTSGSAAATSSVSSASASATSTDPQTSTAATSSTPATSPLAATNTDSTAATNTGSTAATNTGSTAATNTGSTAATNTDSTAGTNTGTTAATNTDSTAATTNTDSTAAATNTGSVAATNANSAAATNANSAAATNANSAAASNANSAAATNANSAAASNPAAASNAAGASAAAAAAASAAADTQGKAATNNPDSSGSAGSSGSSNGGSTGGDGNGNGNSNGGGGDGSGDGNGDGNGDGAASSGDSASSKFAHLSNKAVLSKAKTFVGGYMPATMASGFSAAMSAFHQQAMDMAPFNSPTVSSLFGDADFMSAFTFLPVLAALALVSLAPDGITYDTKYACANPNPNNPLNPCPPVLTANHAVLRSLQASLTVIAVVTTTVVVMWFAKPSGAACDPTSIAGIAAVGGHPELAADFACPAETSTKDLKKRVEGKRYRIGEWKAEDGTKRFGINPDTTEPERGFMDKIRDKLPKFPEITWFDGITNWLDVNWQKVATILDVLFLIYITIIVAIAASYLQHGDKSVFATIFANTSTGRRVAFSVVSALISKYVGALDRDTQTLAPYMELQHLHATPTATIILRKHTLPVTSFLPLLLSGHFVPAAVSFSSLLGQFLIVTMTGMPARDGQTYGEFILCTVSSLFILVFIAFTVIASNIWRRYLPHLPRKPDNVATVLSYIAGSKVCENFEGVERAKIQERDKRILALGRRYGFGISQTQKGEQRWIIDETGNKILEQELPEKKHTHGHQEYFGFGTK